MEHNIIYSRDLGDVKYISLQDVCLLLGLCRLGNQIPMSKDWKTKWIFVILWDRERLEFKTPPERGILQSIPGWNNKVPRTSKSRPLFFESERDSQRQYLYFWLRRCMGLCSKKFKRLLRALTNSWQVTKEWEPVD